jgi:hypothetical protein
VTHLKDAGGDRPNTEEAMRSDAKLLVDIAIKAFMQSHGVNRETAQQWVLNAIAEMISGTQDGS